jgi:hypothetical protein
MKMTVVLLMQIRSRKISNNKLDRSGVLWVIEGEIKSRVVWVSEGEIKRRRAMGKKGRKEEKGDGKKGRIE